MSREGGLAAARAHSLAGRKVRVPDLDRRRILLGLAALPTFGAAGRLAAASGARASERAVTHVPALGRAIAAAGQTGVLAFELETGAIGVSDLARAETRFVPASTFKIPNTLIALETGVVESLDAPVFAWDGKERGISGSPIASWNRDQPLRDAFPNSTVWVYQEVARRIGPERMQRFVDAFDYGNRDLSNTAIDTFWLEGPLRISALEQIRFLERLKAQSLPVSARAQSLVRDVMVVERTNTHTLRGKTGWAGKIGWFVGWIESGKGSRLFALNIDMQDTTSAKARIEIVKAAARDMHLF